MPNFFSGLHKSLTLSTILKAAPDSSGFRNGKREGKSNEKCYGREKAT